MLDGEATVYHRADHHHGHVVCDRCGAVIEVPPGVLRKVASTIERETGFRIERDRVAFGGRCADCATDD
jgi:Fe2+ or Zn2+ uptake regulation protein